MVGFKLSKEKLGLQGDAGCIWYARGFEFGKIVWIYNWGIEKGQGKHPTYEVVAPQQTKEILFFCLI